MGMMTFLLMMKMTIRKYHSHKTLRESLLKLESDFPDIAEVDISNISNLSLSLQVSSIGTSVQGRDLLVLRIAEGIKEPRPLLRPQVTKLLSSSTCRR